jgi:hypothetical protein
MIASTSLRFRTDQFVSRCRVFELPGLASRKCDIPYIFAKGCLDAAKNAFVRISEAVLVGVINSMLETRQDDQSPRTIIDQARQIVAKAEQDHPGGLRSGRTLKLSQKHLPTKLRASVGRPKTSDDFFDFFFRLQFEDSCARLPISGQSLMAEQSFSNPMGSPGPS